jgi:PAS domain S-box-containing protein
MPSTNARHTAGQVAVREYDPDFARLLESVPDAVVGVDRQGLIRYVNRRANSLFGYDRDELVGHHIETLVPESIRPGHPAHRNAYFATHVARRPPPDPEKTVDQKKLTSPKCLHGRHHDGSEFPLNLSLSQIDTEDGMLVIAVVRDMTDRETARRRHGRMSRLAVMVELSKEAHISIGSDGIITGWNPAAERMYGHTSEEMIGRPGWDSAPDR